MNGTIERTMDKTFEPVILAEDLDVVRHIYADFFNGLSEADWDRPVKGSPDEWNLHETVAHLCALNGAGLESIRSTLTGELYQFEGLEHRSQFHDFNRRGIEEHRSLPMDELCVELLGILEGAAEIARNLTPEQTGLASEMPIYNRPIRVIEGLSIIMFHTGLHHSAQVAEPAGRAPLWQQLSSEIRHRVISRVMRALSLLYKPEQGGSLQATLAFQVRGQGGGNWYVKVGPNGCDSAEGVAIDPNLTISLRETDVFCEMFTGRLNLLLSLLTGRLRLRGDLRLFLRMGELFSVEKG